MAKDIKKHVKGIGLKPVSSTGVSEKGELESLDSSGKLNYHNGTSASPVVTESHTATLTNKTIDDDSNTIVNLALTAIKTDALSPDTVLRRNALGVVVNGNELPDTSEIVTVDATQTLENKTIDALTNTVANLPLGSLADSVPDANKVLRRNGGGSVIDGNTIPDSNPLVTTEAVQILTNKTINTADNDLIVALSDLLSITPNSVVRSDSGGAVVEGNSIPNSSAIVTVDATQTLTNKTLTSPTINSGIFTSPSGITKSDVGLADVTNDAQLKRAANDFSSFAEKTSLVNDDILLIEDSEAGGVKKYVKASKVGGSGGDINFLQLSNVSWNAEAGTTGWAAYKDAAATRPVDGTGGSPTLVSITSSSTAPLTGSNSLHIIKASGNAQGEGVSANFTIDNANQARVLKVEFDYNIVSGVFTAGTQTTDSSLIVYLYDVTNNRLIEPSTFKLFSNSTTIADKFQGTFQTSADSTSYRLIFHVATSVTDAFTVRVDSVVVTPSKYVFGTPITDWQDYSPAIIGFGTPTNTVIRWRRVGQNLELTGRFSSGTSTAVAAVIPFPSGLVANTGSVTFGNIYGRAVRSAGVSAYSRDYAMIVASNNTGLNFGDMNPANSSDPASPMNGSSVAGSGQTILFKAEVPIQGWSSSVKISDGFEAREIVFVGNRTSGSQALTANVTDISIPNTIKDSTSSWNGTQFRVPASGDYELALTVAFSGAVTTAIQAYVNGVARATVVFPQSASTAVGSAVLPNLVAGDLISFRSNNAVTIAADTAAYYSIRRIASPQTIAQSEVVYCEASRITSAQALTAAVTDMVMNEKTFDTHNAYNTSNGRFTAPSAGFYEVSIALVVSASMNVGVYRDGTFVKWIGGATSAIISGQANGIYLNAGQYITFRSSDSVNLNTTSNIIIKKVG